MGLFGGNTVVKETRLGIPQQLVFNKLDRRADDVYQGLSDIGPYTGEFLAANPTQRESAGRSRTLAGANLFGGSGAAQDILRLGQSTARGDFVNPNAPYIRGMIEAATRPVNENFTEMILPGIRAGAAGVGGFDNLRRNLVETEAAQNQGNTIADLARQITFSATDAERARQQAAGQIIAQSLPLLLAPGEIQNSIGALERADQDRGYQNELLKFQERVNAMSRPLDATARYQLPLLATGSVTKQTSPGVNPLAALISGALGGASLGSGLGESLGYEDNKWFPGAGGFFGGLAGLFS